MFSLSLGFSDYFQPEKASMSCESLYVTILWNFDLGITDIKIHMHTCTPDVSSLRVGNAPCASFLSPTSPSVLFYVRIYFVIIEWQLSKWREGSGELAQQLELLFLCGGPGFSSQHSRGGSQPAQTLVAEDRMPSFDFCRYKIHMWYTSIHTGKSFLHLIENKYV